MYRMDLQDVWSSVEHLTSVGGGGMKVHKRESSVFDLVAEYSCHHRPSNLSQRILPKVRQLLGLFCEMPTENRCAKGSRDGPSQRMPWDTLHELPLDASKRGTKRCAMGVPTSLGVGTMATHTQEQGGPAVERQDQGAEALHVLASAIDIMNVPLATNWSGQKKGRWCGGSVPMVVNEHVQIATYRVVSRSSAPASAPDDAAAVPAAASSTSLR
jgi:hypothetical protein